MKKTLIAGLVTAAVSTSAMAWTIEGTGSSFQYPANKAWAKDFYEKTGNKVNYSPTGSGAGIKAAKLHQVDFGGTDKPLTPRTLAKYKLTQFPIAIGAITFAYNVPGVKNLKLSERAISGIVLGNIQYWDAPALKEVNPDANLPHKKVLFVHRSDKSGTTFGFTYYLSKMNSVWRTHYGAKKALNWPAPNRIAGKGNFGVSTAIKTNPYSIGYVDYADAVSNNLDMAIIENKEHKFVAPTPKSFAIGAQYADLDPKKDFYANIQYPKKGYPIMTATFVLVPKDKANKKHVAEFYDFAYKHPETAAKLGYVPLPKPVVAKIEKYWAEKGLK
ncbi:phosphate ABC transporter substrate-binding protein PstS [Galenea microaerophila]